ncbi:MAG: hypothetical protein MRJ67_13310 [Nitrospirales bacterium]|nr:hypothetical protein [Nitrospira sp.]MDR4461471.1 hypothetical protein [Nitrospirales bacterium]MDR4481710.1 hypothetical protein [Nitrospirales bacterium]
MRKKTMNQCLTNPYVVLLFGSLLWFAAPEGWAASESGESFRAVATDTQGLQTEMENIIFYYEEKVSETAFIPHELRELPVKRGTSTVKIKFFSIKEIDLKASEKGSPPVANVTLKDGKTGEFQLAIAGSFKGQSAFGEVELPATQLARVVFK